MTERPARTARSRSRKRNEEITQPLPAVTRPSAQALALADGHGWDAVHAHTSELRRAGDDAIVEIDVAYDTEIKAWFNKGLVRLQREHDRIVSEYLALVGSRPLPLLGHAWPDDETVELHALPALPAPVRPVGEVVGEPVEVDGELMPHPDDDTHTGMAPAFVHKPGTFFDAPEGGDRG